MVEQGPIEAKIIEQAFRQRMPLPGRIQNAPALHLGLEMHFAAFMDLSTTRNSGWSIGRIPWSAIHSWGVAAELEEDQMEDLLFLIQQMDISYVEYQRKKAPS